MLLWSVPTRWFVLLLVCVLLVPVQAQAEPDLSRLNLGSHVTGPDIAKRDLEGRFVLVEYWGVNCPPCIAQIPHITKLAKDYGHDRLIVVANHAQSASDDQVKEVWEGRARSNHVVVVNRGNLPGFEVSGIPAAILFDPSGNVVWQGHPAGVDKPLKDAMRNFRPVEPEAEEEPAPEPIVTDVEAKYFKKQVDQINAQRRSIDTPLIQLRRTVDRASSRPAQVEEAQAIVDVVDAWAQQQHVNASELLTSDPATAYGVIEQMQTLLGRDTAAQPFAELMEQMQADKPLMDRVRAMRMLREVLAQAEAIGLTEDPSAAAENRRNSRALRAIERDLARIIRTWPDTDAATQATQLRQDWGLDG